MHPYMYTSAARTFVSSLNANRWKCCGFIPGVESSYARGTLALRKSLL